MSTPPPVPKITELRVEAIHADGTRVFLTYLPEDGGTLQVSLQNVTEEPLDIRARSLPTFWRQNSHQRLDIEGVSTWQAETLVRPGSGGR